MELISYTLTSNKTLYEFSPYIIHKVSETTLLVCRDSEWYSQHSMVNYKRYSYCIRRFSCGPTNDSFQLNHNGVNVGIYIYRVIGNLTIYPSITSIQQKADHAMTNRTYVVTQTPSRQFCCMRFFFILHIFWRSRIHLTYVLIQQLGTYHRLWWCTRCNENVYVFITGFWTIIWCDLILVTWQGPYIVGKSTWSQQLMSQQWLSNETNKQTKLG